MNNALVEKSEEAHPGKKTNAEYPRASIILSNSQCSEVWNYGACRYMNGGERGETMGSEFGGFALHWIECVGESSYGGDGEL